MSEAPINAEPLSEVPNTKDIHHFAAQKGGRATDGLLLGVGGADPWVGLFSAGETPYDNHVILPGSRDVVVISHGALYIVSADDPSDYWIGESLFYTGASAISESSVIAATPWWLERIENRQQVWRLEPDSDGITILDILPDKTIAIAADIVGQGRRELLVNGIDGTLR